MKRLIKASMLLIVAALFAACASEDIAQDKKKENGTEAPKGGVVFATNDTKISAKRRFIDEDEFADAKTRTNIKHTPGNGADAYWTSDDFIWVKDKNGTWQKSTGTTLHDGGTSAEFTLPGNKTDYADGCEVRYTGTSLSYYGLPLAATSVGFPRDQSRTVANDFSKAGEWGDCGSGVARNTGNPNKFNFTLHHKSAYLCFLPRCGDGLLAPNIRLKNIKIIVTKSQNTDLSFFAVYHGFDGESLSTNSSPFIGDYINVSLPDFPLYTYARQADNATYLAVAPDTYDFTIEYTIKDPTTNVETVIKDTRTGITLDKGNIYDVTADLSSFNTNINNPKTFKYYMWDAKQNYWYGYENLQPRFNGVYSERYPKDNHDLRWYNESYPGYGIRNDAQTKFFKTLPNANEIFWYAYNGDPHWVLSKNHLTIINGHLIKQDKVVGVWLKKKAKICHDENITDEQMKNGYPKVNPSDWRKTHGHWPNNIHVNTTPVPNTTDYFFLPAAGYYTDGTLDGLDGIGIYWSSSAHPWFPKCAYFLYFDETELYTYHYRYLCDYGLSAQPFK